MLCLQFCYSWFNVFFGGKILFLTFLLLFFLGSTWGFTFATFFNLFVNLKILDWKLKNLNERLLKIISNLKKKIHYFSLGEAPVGKPHLSGVREEDIELVDAQVDKDGNVVVGSKSGFAGVPDYRTQDEIDGVDSESDSEEDEPKAKKKKDVVFHKASE